MVMSARESGSRRPDFFIVGGPKCGTTAMYTYLREHPEIYMPALKEPHFFGADIRHPGRRSLEQYLSLFAQARDQKRLGEASISYLFSRCAAREIKDFNPSSRIIIMLRNPVDMMYSWHGQLLSTGIENVTDFESALNLEEKRRQGLCVPDPSVTPQAYLYRQLVRYSHQVQRYLDVFDRDRVHIIIFDDLKLDRSGVCRKTLRFLEVKSEFEPNLKVVNPGKRVYSAALQNFLRHPPHVVQKLSRALLPRRFRDSLSERLRHLNTFQKTRPPMDPELRSRLKAEFASEVAGLSKLIDR